MMQQQRSWFGLIVVLGIALPALALAKSVKVEDGAKRPESDFSSVNGSVTIGTDAVVGDLSTVNGSIRVGTGTRGGRIESVNGTIRVADSAEVGAIEAVNGSIELERNVLVKGGVKSVNGGVRTSQGSHIEGSVETINGEMELEGTSVDGDLETYQGRIKLSNSEVAGDLRVRKPRGPSSWFGREKATRVIIGANSVVQGDLYFDKKVKLEIDASATVGTIHGEQVEMVEDGRRYK